VRPFINGYVVLYTTIVIRMIPLWSIPLATVTGNTLILKPSERDPGAAMIIAELCQRAGLPPGVVNVVHGTVPTVNAICDHPSIKAISFVGGDRAGKHIYERFAFSAALSCSFLLIGSLKWDEERQKGPIKYGCQEPRRNLTRW
jgi:acyl-CoA reductase-like NAD-dependent aldehyde dehydrogenase